MSSYARWRGELEVAEVNCVYDLDFGMGVMEKFSFKIIFLKDAK